MKIKCTILIISLVFACTICPCPAHSKADTATVLDLGSLGEVTIDAGPAKISIGEETIAFSNGVTAKSDNMTMTCETLVIQFKSTEVVDSSDIEGEVTGMTATGAVHVTRTQGKEVYDITSDKAVYDKAGNRMVMTGSPAVVKRGKHVLKGNIITVTFKKNAVTQKDEVDEILVEPAPGERVQAVLYLKEEKK